MFKLIFDFFVVPDAGDLSAYVLCRSSLLLKVSNMVSLSIIDGLSRARVDLTLVLLGSYIVFKLKCGRVTVT